MPASLGGSSFVFSAPPGCPVPPNQVHNRRPIRATLALTSRSLAYFLPDRFFSNAWACRAYTEPGRASIAARRCRTDRWESPRLR